MIFSTTLLANNFEGQGWLEDVFKLNVNGQFHGRCHERHASKKLRYDRRKERQRLRKKETSSMTMSFAIVNAEFSEGQSSTTCETQSASDGGEDDDT